MIFQVVVELQKADLAGSQTDLGEYCTTVRMKCSSFETMKLKREEESVMPISSLEEGKITEEKIYSE